MVEMDKEELKRAKPWLDALNDIYRKIKKLQSENREIKKRLKRLESR